MVTGQLSGCDPHGYSQVSFLFNRTDQVGGIFSQKNNRRKAMVHLTTYIALKKRSGVWSQLDIKLRHSKL